MGSFINTNYSKTVDNLVKGSQERLNNPYYLFSSKKPTNVTYWNINIKKTTLDMGTKQTYDHIGENSSLRFNKINSFQLYGINRIEVDMNLGEYGVESPVEGEALILPNTIIPSVDDMFTIDYLSDKPIIFRVNKVSIDTLENGSNFYRIQYYLDRTDETALDYLNSKQLVNEYNYKPGNVGSNFVALIYKSDSDLIDNIQSEINTLKKYFQNLFFKNNIQTFVYDYNCMRIYDPYLIEFLIRNNIYENEENYMYISQAIHTSETFSIEYDNSIFKYIEKNNHNFKNNSCYPVLVHDPNSLLIDRLEDYYELSINLVNKDICDPINWLNMDLFDRITENNPYDAEDPSEPIYRNIIINSLNKIDYKITQKEIDSLHEIRFHYCKDLFYELPILIFVLNNYINSLQTNNSGNSHTSNQLAVDMKDDSTNNSFCCRCNDRSIETPDTDDSYMTGK